MSDEIEYAELSDNLSSVVLVDVRNPDELGRTGKIPTSKNVPLKELEDAMGLAGDEFEEKYGFDKPEKDTQLVTHCMNGSRARKAFDLLKGMGYNARVYEGSFNDWKENGGRVKPGKP